MDLEIRLSGDYSDERIASLTRDFLREVRETAEPDARLKKAENSEAGTKGDVVTIGAIVLAFLSGGGLKAFIESVTTLVTVNRKLKVDLVNARGEKMSVDAQYLTKNEFEKLQSDMSEFMSRPKKG